MYRQSVPSEYLTYIIYDSLNLFEPVRTSIVRRHGRRTVDYCGNLTGHNVGISFLDLKLINNYINYN